MSIRKKAVGIYFNHLKYNQSSLLKPLAGLLRYTERVRVNSKLAIAEIYPKIIKPEVRVVYMALTSKCNLRCEGCDYGRDFMSGDVLEFDLIKSMFDDMKFHQIPNIWLYGGEPLAHKRIDDIVEYACGIGLHPILGTNAILLKPEKMDQLYQLGLRQLSIGVYGTEDEYNNYVNKKNRFSQLESNLTYISSTYPDVQISLGFLLMKPTCNVKALQDMVDLAQKHSAKIGINLVHYDFPYFNNGEKDQLQLYREDLPQINQFVAKLAQLKKELPDLFLSSAAAINAIPDWLIEKENLDIPCLMYDNIWVAANGDVMVCQKNMTLGNVHEKSLKELLYTEDHTKSVQDTYELNCSRCHVKWGPRTEKHRLSKKKYGKAIVSN